MSSFPWLVGRACPDTSGNPVSLFLEERKRYCALMIVIVECVDALAFSRDWSGNPSAKQIM